MSHFYGIIQGNRGQASRGGTKDSGYSATAASWEGSVRVYLYYDEEKGCDMVNVSLSPWHGSGTSKGLYFGPVSGEEQESE